MEMKGTRIRLSLSDKIYHAFNYFFLGLAIVLVSIPLINVISQSISDPSAVLNGKVTFLPVGFTLETYGYVFRDKSIMSGYANSILYTVVYTVIGVILTICAAYPLARKNLYGRKTIMFLFVFTMMFNGGMIPTYLVVRDLGLIDTIWAFVLPNAISAYNIIIARTFFMTTIPEELYEAAEIDGSSDMRTFLRIVLPLSKSIVAVMVLFFAVYIWNCYFEALIYINSKDKYPLTMVLRSIMTSAQMQSQMIQATGQVRSQDMLGLTESLKYATIVCASLPVLALYPIIQKHFTKGLMLGTVKG